MLGLFFYCIEFLKTNNNMNYLKLKYIKYVIFILFLYILFSILIRTVNIYTILFLILIMYIFYNIDKKLFKKIVYEGDAFHTFHPVGGQGLNTCWRDVNTIYDLFNKNTAITKLQFILFKFKYLSSRILDIIVTIFITDSLISLFANRNVFLFPIRKFSFLLLNNVLFIRKLVLNQMTKSLIYSSIKYNS